MKRMRSFWPFLAVTGDVAAWQAAITTAQTAIVANRTAYWNKASAQLSTQLGDLSSQLTGAAASWKAIASGRI